MNRAEELKKLRKLMNTLPEDQPPREDKIYIGVEKIKVKMIDWPQNPYKAIYSLAAATWGSAKNWAEKWRKTSVQGRILVVKAALSGQTLPQCLETPSFTFEIQGLSRSAFDQLARTRQSAIGSVGFRDNSHRDACLRISSSMAKYKDKIEKWWKDTKDLYDFLITEGRENWQNARAIMPMGTCWRFVWSMNYRALKDMCGKRMCFAEQSDTVATSWLIREEIKKKFPFLAAYLRPFCDFSRKCLYQQAYSLSEAFGVLFKPCGRWPVDAKYEVATFNYSSTSKEELEKQLRIKIPNADDYIEEPSKKDMRYFEED